MKTTTAVTPIQSHSQLFVYADSHNSSDDKEKEEILQRKITLATEGFITIKSPERVLKDRNRLSQENALTISEYIIAMKREVNPRLSYIRNIIQFLYELTKSTGIEKKFVDMIRDDILSYLDKCCKLENEDPLHKWVGSYNIKRITLIRFFKWLHYPGIDSPKKEVNYPQQKESLNVLWVLLN